VTDEEPVLSTDRLAAQLELAPVVVNGQAAVFEETRKANALVSRVANTVGDRGVVENDERLGVAPGEKAIDDRARTFAANLLALFFEAN
jgi:hypothetical protein